MATASGVFGGEGFLVLGLGAGRNRADAEAQLVRIRGFARPQPRPERPVFVGEGKKKWFAAPSSESLSPLAARCIKRIAERSLFRSYLIQRGPSER